MKAELGARLGGGWRQRPPRGAMARPDSGGTLPARPPRSPALQAAQERRFRRQPGSPERGHSGEADEPSGDLPSVHDGHVGLVRHPPPPGTVPGSVLVPLIHPNPKAGGGGQQADKAGGTPAPRGVAVWWQGHLGSVGPLTESASGHLGGSALTSHTWWVNFSEKPLLSTSLNTKAPFYVMMRAPTLSEDTLILNM